MPPDIAPYDALLLVSFGGPEKAEDVLPFLENVTRGRGIPRERLEEVGEHYYLFGGRSPINDQNRRFIAAVEEDLRSSGIAIGVYWGNRNWDPYLSDTLAQMQADGVRRAACLVTSAYSSYSGCRQYRENLAEAVATVSRSGVEVPRLDRLRHYFNHPGFVDAMVRNTVAAVGQLPEGERAEAELVFVTHSIPVAMNAGSGPRGGAYEAQHLEVARLVGEGVDAVTGRPRARSLVYCSRSGPPGQPWLGPDVNDHLRQLAAEGRSSAVLVPIGFISDHMEVRFDLDAEALETAGGLGLACSRAATVGTDPSFVAAVRELVLERAAVERGETRVRRALGDLGPSHDACPAGCCPNLRAPGTPALCGLD
jgi:protoporphyrin/coproporphyrin ferrochelatase